MSPTSPGLQIDAFSDWWARAFPDRPAVNHVTMLTGGRSNLSYVIAAGEERWVVRRPPLGHRMETAHDMGREVRVQRALEPTAVPVPRILASVPADPSTGIDTDFYVMEHVAGRALATLADNAGFSSAEIRAASLDLAGVLADLHSVDPARAGLADFGRPAGFLARQVRRWGTQRAASTSRPIPGFDELEAKLTGAPETQPAIVHGDYKLNNVLLHLDRPSVAAVLDWEMATLGDRLADLALLGVYWALPERSPVAREHFESSVDARAGYPDFDELLDAYAERLGTPAPDLSWHLVFAAYKLAVINESLHYRWVTGGTAGEGFERVGELTADIVELGLEHASRMTRKS